MHPDFKIYIPFHEHKRTRLRHTPLLILSVCFISRFFYNIILSIKAQNNFNIQFSNSTGINVRVSLFPSFFGKYIDGDLKTFYVFRSSYHLSIQLHKHRHIPISSLPKHTRGLFNILKFNAECKAGNCNFQVSFVITRRESEPIARLCLSHLVFEKFDKKCKHL